jgi:predicted acyltransferase
MTTAPAPQTPVSQRLMSLDALRGFDMFWIIGADSLVYALNRMSQTEPTKFLAYQLDHAEWEGFRFYDLIFPLFIFMVGASVVFSLSRTVAQHGRSVALKRVLWRSAILFAVGLFYSGGFTNPWPDMRLMGVLNRIALAYLGAGLLFIYFKPRALIAWCAGLLLGYWALMATWPIRDIELDKSRLAEHFEMTGDVKTAKMFRDAGNASAINPSAIKNSPVWAATEKIYLETTNRVTGRYGPGYNVACHFDFEHLLGRKYDLFWDPEGILSTIPAVASCLLGVFCGLLLMNPGLTDQRKVALLIGTGAVSAAIGWAWGLEFPIIKKIWTSSYVLVAGGFSAMLLGAFYLVVDVWKWRRWCQAFVWLGMNSITIYLTKNFLGGTFNKLSSRLVGGDISTWLNESVAKGCGDLMVALVGLALAIWLVRFLHKRQIFLRL